MKRSSVYQLLGLCLVGFLAGRFSKGFKSSASEEAKTAGKAGQSQPGLPGNGISLAGGSPADTLGTLEQVTDLSLYRRLALWMVRASESDIAAFWDSYRQRENRDEDVEELIFLNWTRLNPGRAIAAVAGTEVEGVSWAAWTCNDPETALVAAKAVGGDALLGAVYGAGEYRPAWLRAHFEEIPEEVRYAAFRGWDLWPDNETPLATLKFLNEQGKGINPGLFRSMTSGVAQGAFKALVRTDPFTAMEWLRAHGSDKDRKYDERQDTPMRDLIDSLAEADPQMLQKLVDSQPSSALRRKMEAALFERSLKDDPEGALSLARGARSPRTAANEMAKAAMVLGASDPDRACAVCLEILRTYPNVMMPAGSYGAHFPGGEDNPVAGVSQLIDSVVASHPNDLLAAASSEKPGGGASDFDSLSERWAAKDLEAYAKWVNQQTDAQRKGEGATIVSGRLARAGEYQQAVEWAISSDVSRVYLVSELCQWAGKDPEACQRWMKSATLSPEEAKAFEQQLNARPHSIHGR